MGAAVFIGAVYGCLLAMAFFSYLMNRRSVGMIHALPIKREGLFFTNWLSGVLFTAGPSLLIFLVALLAEAGKVVVGPEELLLWLLVNVSVTLLCHVYRADFGPSRLLPHSQWPGGRDVLPL